jgi:broad specificity phosphatase PhoE
MMDTLAWMIRHGQSEANAGIVSERRGSPPLTELGERQAQAAADLVLRPPDLVVTSSFIRAVQTAEPLLRRFPGTQSEVWEVEEFTYLAPAKYDHSTTSERRPFVEAYWKRCDPEYCDGEGAETFRRFIDRVARAAARLKRRKGFTVMVSHGQFMRGLIWWSFNCFHEVTPEVMARYRDFRTAVVLPNACIVKMGWPEGAGPWFSGITCAHADALDDES